MRETIKLILEAVKETKSFEKKYGLELPEDITKSQLKDIEKAFSYVPQKLIKKHIKKIVFKDLGSVRGQYNNSKKEITINPKIFKHKVYYRVGDKKIPRKIFTIVHEIGHMIDHLEGISKTQKWRNLSDWKKLSTNKKVPKGYDRYVEKRTNVKSHGQKSDWVYGEDAEFSRFYGSRNPAEDFADLFAFIIFGKDFDFNENGLKKVKIIKDLLK
jgi:hypothetical protein